MNALAPYACVAQRSLGRVHPEPPASFRSEFQRDRDRIVHSAAFRRLEYKTQVFVNHEGDLYRTRLTHSLEVAQIARTIARTLALNEDLVEAICLAHDLGHTPFGHAGQDALNHCLSQHGGFEHNAQSLRVVDVLEDHYAEFPGLNLSFETREGILKHCSRRRAAQLGPVAERFVSGGSPSLEAQVANVADEIAYNNHDIDDGLRAGLLSVEQLRSVPLFARCHDEVLAVYPRASAKQQRHETVRRMIGGLVEKLVSHSRSQLLSAAPQSVAQVRTLPRPLIGYDPATYAETRQLKKFLLDHLYRHPQVYRVMHKAQRTLKQLFELFMEDPLLMPPSQAAQAAEHEQSDGPTGRARIVADYIAGMTDRYALDEWERLFDPRRLR